MAALVAVFSLAAAGMADFDHHAVVHGPVVLTAQPATGRIEQLPVSPNPVIASLRQRFDASSARRVLALVFVIVPLVAAIRSRRRCSGERCVPFGEATSLSLGLRAPPSVRILTER